MYVVEMEDDYGHNYVVGVYADIEHAKFAAWCEEAATEHWSYSISWHELNYIDPIKQDQFEEWCDDE